MPEQPKWEVGGPSKLGEQQISKENNQYTGAFRGRGFVDADAEASFLSDNAGSYIRTLDMADLFPIEWMGSEVEYEITVKARFVEKSTQQ